MPAAVLPSIPRVASTYDPRVAEALKEIVEVRNNRRPVGSLDRFVSVRDLTDDAETVAYLTSGHTHDHGGLTGKADDDHTQYLLAAGTRGLSGNWDIGAGRLIQAEEIRARSAAGLKLTDDAGGYGIFVEDGGQVGIGTATPQRKMEIYSAVSSYLRINGAAGVQSSIEFATAGTSKWINYITGSDDYLHWYDGSAHRVTFKTGGNVGLGVTAPTAVLHLKAGTATASTAPLKFTVAGAALLTTAEVGVLEPFTDDLYYTITTGAARKGVVLTDGFALTSGRVPYCTTNGRLTDSANLTFNGTELEGPGTIYFGPSGTNGTWKIMVSGNDLVFQRREAGSYVEKGRFTA